MTTTPTRQAASRLQSDFARAAVYLEFRGRDARAIEQGAFVDRQPDRLPRRRSEVIASGEVALDQLAAALRQVGGDAESSAA